MEITERQSQEHSGVHWSTLSHPGGPLEPTEAHWGAIKDACSEALHPGFQADKQDLFR